MRGGAAGLLVESDEEGDAGRMMLVVAVDRSI
jgi:hypothetical protein